MTTTDDDSYLRLTSAGLVLTPNNRLAEYLREYLCERAAAATAVKSHRSEIAPAQLSTQSLPAIFPYHSWIAELSAKAALAGFGASQRVLSKVEETVLWQAIIARASDVDLLAPALAAAEAQRASQLLQDWCVDAAEHAFEFSSIPDCAIFYQWHQEFLLELQRRQFFTAGQAQAALLELDTTQLRSLYALHANARSAPAEGVQTRAHAIGQLQIVTAGFYTMTPLQQRVIAHFSAALADTANQQTDVTAQESIHLARDGGTIAVSGYENLAAEIHAAARWARAESAAAPGARIAIVVPDLAAQKNVVERIMRQVFYAEARDRGCSIDYSIDRYNISAGTALAKLPMVEVFLQLLQGILQPLTIDSWQALLFSPYLFADYAGLAGRNLIVEAMYQSGESEFLLGEIPALVHWHRQQREQSYQRSSHPVGDLGGLALPVEIELIAALDASPDALLRGMRSGRTATPSIWLEHFQRVLEQLQWPGSRGLDSDEFQQHQLFSESCTALWQSDQVVGEVAAGAALAFIRQHLQNIVYHKQTRVNPLLRPPQVFGVLEASGQLFDRLWVTGLSEQSWPARPAANALIPFALQARLHMPGASEPREFDYAERVTRSLMQAAGQLQVSYLNAADGVELRLAPVVEAYLRHGEAVVQDRPQEQSSAPAVGPDASGQKPPAQLAGEIPRTTAAAVNTPFEALEDYNGTAYPEYYDASQRRVLRRGIAHLRDCAINPLLAYARHRLELEPLPQTQPGLSALERGNVLHAALEHCWEQLQSSAGLQAEPADQLDALVSKSVAKSLRAVNRQRYRRLGDRFISLQQSVFEKLLGSWLALEKERPEFAVAALEKTLGGRVGDFFITGRIDRIDQLANGELLFIDYKTGNASSQGWLDERLSSPQLPFYVLAAQAEAESEPRSLSQALCLRVSESSLAQPAALAFAILKPGEVGFRGLAEAGSDASAIDGVDDLRPPQRELYANTAALQQHWLASLQQRCDEIARGFAALELDLSSMASESAGPYEPFMRTLAALASPLEPGAAAQPNADDGGHYEL